MKKKLLLSLAIFIISTKLFSQNLTYIPGPAGYGTNATADDKTLVPFFKDQSYIYCSTYKVISTNPIVRKGCIVRVDVSDNNQYVYPDPVSLPTNGGFNAKKLNNNIFFNIGIRLARINTTTNKLTVISNDAEDYEIFDHYIIYENYNYSGLYILDLNTNVTTQIYSPNNKKFYRLGATYYDKDTGMLYFRSQYITMGVYYGFYKYNPSTKAITEIVGRNVVSGSEIYQQRDEIAKVNDNLVFLMKDTDYKMKYFSANVTTGLLNTSFTFNTNTVYDTSVNDLMVYNNTVYITSGGKVLTSDGVTIPVETNYQPFFEYSTGNSIDVVSYNSESYIQQYSPEYGSELWKYNWTLMQKQLVKDITPGTQGSFASNISGGFLHKNKLLYVVNVGPLAYSLYATDGTSDGTLSVLGSSKFTLISKILTEDDTLYFYGENATNKGLFALDYQILSNENFSKDKKINFYPNPVKSDLNFSEKMNEVKIMDLNGKILGLEKNIFKLSLENLPKGIYLIEFKSENQEKIIEKFIKI